MEKLRVLVLGNDPQINEIEFDRLARDVITLGINRIWLKHLPNYFFFNDYEIVQELEQRPETLAQLREKSTIFSSDWLVKNSKKQRKPIPNWIRVFDRPNQHRYPDSTTTAIEIFRNALMRTSNISFYVAGVSLKWQEPSHFWKTERYSGLNKKGKDWYLPRFERMLENFKQLKGMRYNIVSVNPNSNLNRIFRYESLGNLYSDRVS